MNIKELTKEMAFSYNVDIDPWNKEGYHGFIAGAEWERNRDKLIIVKDKLPEEDQVVMAYTTGSGVIPCKYELNSFYRYIDRMPGDRTPFIFYPDVTHWQPLPEPPKEEEK